MNLIFNLDDKLIKSIYNKKKILFFGNNFSEKTKKAKKIYICNQGKIIGECKIETIQELKHSKYGVTNFILFWSEKIQKNEEVTKELKKALDYDLPNYDTFMKLEYLYNLKYLDYIKKDDNCNFIFYLSDEERKIFFKNKEKTQEIIEECDKWLSEIGYYNENNESFFKKYIEISEIILYNKYIDLKDFKNQKGQNIQTTPKNWCYTLN